MNLWLSVCALSLLTSGCSIVDEPCIKNAELVKFRSIKHANESYEVQMQAAMESADPLARAQGAKLANLTLLKEMGRIDSAYQRDESACED